MLRHLRLVISTAYHAAQTTVAFTSASLESRAAETSPRLLPETERTRNEASVRPSQQDDAENSDDNNTEERHRGVGVGDDHGHHFSINPCVLEDVVDLVDAIRYARQYREVQSFYVIPLATVLRLPATA